jgi:hypothetical protein
MTLHRPALVQQLIAPRTACGALYAQLPRHHKVDPDLATCEVCLNMVFVRLTFVENWDADRPKLTLFGLDVFRAQRFVRLEGAVWWESRRAHKDAVLLVEVPKQAWGAQDAIPEIKMELCDRDGVPEDCFNEPSFVGGPV